MLTKENIADWFKQLQDDICQKLEKTDSVGKFKQDEWERPGGGGGRSRVLTEGKIIEKGGVNFSAVEGKTPEKILKALHLDSADFFATGVSIVLHPHNPFVPIIHMNVRYFEMSNGVWWFGGGIDLTPHYIDEDDASFFHKQLKNVCDKHDSDYYDKFKKWADDYFYIKHRKETRGIGGIFFDRLNQDSGKSKEEIFAFVQDVGKTFAPTYTHFMSKNHDLDYNEDNIAWQKLRRGRYVEFNLVWDKGTKFGLETDGRTESILMSLPPQANWEYDHTPIEGSQEEETLKQLKKGIDWIN
ncbi:oxygen-dependent coproporphyrinogen oxidase [Fulvivirga sp. RKSG066]|uniref:oxygen-dependent coproporphyrinogen oxidase n=1 Tax=Fulvivirga aurantia TaxID=2529383 RepID=UPI0012BBB83F|nr:oxygen-dependent coproporphyrinogen oxidase [Fulvivirga aurantia]MTI23213.1 oxygen-dependent coproporphyrinogen oxidase [Fulvivirga aurantia]